MTNNGLGKHFILLGADGMSAFVKVKNISPYKLAFNVYAGPWARLTGAYGMERANNSTLSCYTYRLSGGVMAATIWLWL